MATVFTENLLAMSLIQEDAMSVADGKRKLQRPLPSLALLLSLVLATCSASAWGEDAYSMEPVRPRASAQFPASLVNAVRPQGFRVFSHAHNEKTVICEIFWARSVAALDSRREVVRKEDGGGESSKVLYGGLKTGTFIGVIHFRVVERYVRDFRSQMFKSGYYTMRYAVLPEGANGSELDFVVLSPVSADPNPGHTVPLDELVRRGRRASHTRRATMMSLVEVDTDQSFPSLNTDDSGTCVLQVKLRLQSRASGPAQELPVALVVVTSIPEDLGD
jgi:hypothetical protein